MKIRVGDQVIVRRGKDKGRKGKVSRVLVKKQAVLVPGVNVYKRHRKSQTKGAGEIVEVARPLPVGAVMVVCPSCGKPSRVGWLVAGGGKKERVCKRCGGMMGKE